MKKTILTLITIFAAAWQMAAQMLGISRRTLYNKLERYELG